MTAPMPRRSYKEVQLQQIRSFCETARLGSLMAAAEHLGLSQPTVCEQVHALERALELKLVERHRHGCRPTDAGSVVADLASPLVAGIGSLKRAVHEALGRTEPVLTITATQRVLADDLPDVVVEFERSYPDVRLRLLEVSADDVADTVESGKADLGFLWNLKADPLRPTLAFEPAYELEYFLVTPKDHPLARRPRIRPVDLVPFPLVNAPVSIVNPSMAAELERLGAFRTQPRRVEAVYAAVVRRYVRLGFGIGLVSSLPDHVTETPDLHERSMSRYFGRELISFVRRRSAVPNESLGAFVRIVRTHLAKSSRTHPTRASRNRKASR